MHSLEELKRQLDAAKSRRVDADKKYRDAEKALHDKLEFLSLNRFEECGASLGETLVYPKNWKGVTIKTHGEFVVTGAYWEYGKMRFRLRRLKKSGDPSNAPSGHDSEAVEIVSTGRMVSCQSQ